MRVRRTAAVQQKQKLTITDSGLRPRDSVKAPTRTLLFNSHTLKGRDFFFFFRQQCTAYGVLGPRSRVEAPSPAVEVQSLNHWTVRQAPGRDYY